MPRTQKNGKQKPWTLEQLRSGLSQFYDTYGHYPTASEVDAFPYLPSARSIQRRFDGLVELRKILNLDTQADLRSGEHSSRRAFTINQRAHEMEKVVYKFLCNRFSKEFVHREYFFLDDRRTRTDFFIYDQGQGFCVDVFYPHDRHNLIGCLNSKLNKYDHNHMGQYPVIFLQMNEDIQQEILDKIVSAKKKALRKQQRLMSWGTFQIFCKSRASLRIMKDAPRLLSA